jgi:hypothetical protein
MVIARRLHSFLQRFTTRIAVFWLILLLRRLHTQSMYTLTRPSFGPTVATFVELTALHGMHRIVTMHMNNHESMSRFTLLANQIFSAPPSLVFTLILYLMPSQARRSTSINCNFCRYSHLHRYRQIHWYLHYLLRHLLSSIFLYLLRWLHSSISCML